MTERELSSIYNIKSVITSWTSQITNIDRRRNGTKTSNIITVQTSKCENNHGNKDRSLKMISIGDSHMRG